MKTKKFALTSGLGVLILGLLTLLNGVIVSPSIAQEPAPIGVINYNGNEELLPEAVKEKLPDLLRYGWVKERSEDNSFVIGSVRNEGEWGLVTIVPKAKNLRGDEHASEIQTNNVGTLAFVRDEKEWNSALGHQEEIKEVVDLIPDDELPQGIKSSLFTGFNTPSFGTTSISYSQKSFRYKFPFASSNGFRLTRSDRYWHSSGDKAIDFAPLGDVNVLASESGYVSGVCKNSNGNQAWVWIKTEKQNNPGSYYSNEKLQYLHLRKGTLTGNIKVGKWVDRGEVMGKLVDVDDESNLPCRMNSDGRHVHILFPYKPFYLDDRTFTTYGNGDLKILDINDQEVSFNSSTTFYSSHGVTPPNTWVIENNQVVDSFLNETNNILIKRGGSLTVDGANMNFDFLNRKIEINIGGKLETKNGGKID